MEHARILQDEFKLRRDKLVKNLEPDSIVVLTGASIVFRNNDTELPFRQDSDFYYLTGINEADATCVLTIDSHHNYEYILFTQPKNPEQEQWTGTRIGIEAAKQYYGASKAYENVEINIKLPELMLNKKNIYYLFTDPKDLASLINKWERKAQSLLRAKMRSIERTVVCVPNNIRDLTKVLHEMRLIKSEAEINCIKQAATISATAHKKLMQSTRDTKHEYELAALFEYECKKAGSPMLAYPSIVGSGKNACILHYVDNNAKFAKDSLVLVDAGCEVDYYAADITRVFPVNGKFTEAQANIYNLVLESQVTSLEQVKPGNTFNKVQEVILEILTAGIAKLGLPGDIKRYYMHNSGHWLGLDVHDRGEYKVEGAWREFSPGMVLTVEPGLYIPRDADIPEEYRGIGIRIEDDILVTKNGHEVLTSIVPKTIAEIEAVINS